MRHIGRILAIMIALLAISPVGTALAAKPTASLAAQARDINTYVAGQPFDSPLQGYGNRFVACGLHYGVDPRVIVAIARHENVLGTEPRDLVTQKHNTWGIGGPIQDNESYPSWNHGIWRASQLLGESYRDKATLAGIGGKWAPIGAGNDPQGLNSNWGSGVGKFYAELGGDPSANVFINKHPSIPCSAGDSAPKFKSTDSGSKEQKFGGSKKVSDLCKSDPLACQIMASETDPGWKPSWSWRWLQYFFGFAAVVAALYLIKAGLLNPPTTREERNRPIDPGAEQSRTELTNNPRVRVTQTEVIFPSGTNAKQIAEWARATGLTGSFQVVHDDNSAEEE